MSKKFYAVTKGCYSSYHIITITDDRKLAEQIVEKFNDNWDKPCIEEYTNAELLLRNIWFVRFDNYGNIINSYEEDSEYFGGKLNKFKKDDRGIYVYVEADYQEEAVKIASELRFEYIARKLGLS